VIALEITPRKEDLGITWVTGIQRLVTKTGIWKEVTVTAAARSQFAIPL